MIIIINDCHPLVFYFLVQVWMVWKTLLFEDHHHIKWLKEKKLSLTKIRQKKKDFIMTNTILGYLFNRFFGNHHYHHHHQWAITWSSSNRMMHTHIHTHLFFIFKHPKKAVIQWENDVLFNNDVTKTKSLKEFCLGLMFCVLMADILFFIFLVWPIKTIPGTI